MALIYELANPIGINDTQITFRIKDHLGVDLTTTDDGIKLVNAVDYMNSDFTYSHSDTDGTILTIRNFAFTLGHGYEAGGFNYDDYFQALSQYSFDHADAGGQGTHQHIQGSLAFTSGTIWQTFPAYAYLRGKEIASNGSSHSTYWGTSSGYSYSPPESIEWEQEDYSVLITFNLPTSGDGDWGSDSVQVKHYSNQFDVHAGNAGFDVTMGDAPFVGELPTFPYTNFYADKVNFFGYEGCIGAIFSIIDINGSQSNQSNEIRIYPTSEVPEILDSSNSNVVCLQPYVWGEAPEG